MRAFIAIELPQQIKDCLSKLQSKLKSANADVKWVDPQNIHLTLKFLGEINDEQLTRISEALETVANGMQQFPVRLSVLGAFPKIDYPRVIWVGIDKGDSQIKDIAEELDKKIEKIGIPKEDKEFSSHITIGRLKSASNRTNLVQDLISLENKLGGENLEFLVAKITLFKSTLVPLGPIYEVLKIANLKTS